MIRKVKQQVDLAIGKRKDLDVELIRAKKDLAEKDEQIEKLISKEIFLRKEAAKVEGLLDETIRQANFIEDLQTDLENLYQQIGEGLVN